MSYKLDLDQDLSSAARKVVREQLQEAAERLRDGQEDDPVGAVHKARKNVKKSRSALRLIRPDLGKGTYKRENRELRDASRSVAHVRDADVMAETVDALHERFAGQLPADSFKKLRTRLRRRAGQARRQQGNGEVGQELRETLETVAVRVDEWPLEDADWATARRGIARSYRRGRKAFRKAEADPTTENLHEFRKRVKDLWYHERLLKPAWPAVVGAQADEAHLLSDLLGDDHDLAVLAEHLRSETPTEDTDAILELIEQRRGELLAHIRPLARRIYAEKPKRFAGRIERYMRCAETADPVPG